MRNSHRYSRSSISKITQILVSCVTAWFFGFIVFLAAIPQPANNKKNVSIPADAIVVLTGGAERVKEGFRLLGTGNAEKLFISGVKPGISINQLLSSLEPSGFSVPENISNRLELGYEASSTIGNAEEVAYWMAERGFSKIILVTASYHMNRALLEFRSFLPWAEIYPNPAYPPEMLDPYWWAKPKTLSLLVTEYHKFVLALLRQIGLTLHFLS